MDMTNVATLDDLRQLGVATQRDIKNLAATTKRDAQSIRSELKGDIYDLREDMRVMKTEIIDSVGEILGDAMQIISGNFAMQQIQLTNLQETVDRMDNKLTATVDRVDDHESRITTLEA